MSNYGTPDSSISKEKSVHNYVNVNQNEKNKKTIKKNQFTIM